MALGKKLLPSKKMPSTRTAPSGTDWPMMTEPPCPVAKVPLKIWPPSVNSMLFASMAIVPALPVLPG